jgi:GGDEF domain-containing protein
MRRQILLIAADASRKELRALFAGPVLNDWRAEEVQSLEQAGFLYATQSYDALVLDAGCVSTEEEDGLRWVARQNRTPILLLADVDPVRIEQAFRLGVSLWLPRDLVQAHPALLDAALHQAVALWQGPADLRARLAECQDRTQRLLGLLWEAAPGAASGSWFTQRHMLQRLDEEMARSRRTGSPLTIVLGDVRPEAGVPLADAGQLAVHTAKRVGSSKRRCDVAGRYGMQGFMLLLPQSGSDQAVRCCHRLAPLLESPTGGPMPPLHVSFGVAGAGTSATVQGLLGRAEEHLERALRQGGGVVSDP